jgi:hypothetical protein
MTPPSQLPLRTACLRGFEFVRASHGASLVVYLDR